MGWIGKEGQEEENVESTDARRCSQFPSPVPFSFRDLSLRQPIQVFETTFLSSNIATHFNP